MKNRLTKKALAEMLKNDYTMLYRPMPDEVKAMFPVFTVDDSNDINGLHFTVNHTGKMKALQSLSTTCKAENSVCRSRVENAFRLVRSDFNIETANKEEVKGARKALSDYIKRNPLATDASICGFCFSDKQQDYQTSMVPTLARNFEILNSGLIHPDWLPVLNVRNFRGESFGDFASTNSVLNFVAVANKNPETTFAVWTKNPAFFYLAFKKVEKPENMIIILSSEKINQEREVDSRFSWFIDKVFTVYTKQSAKAENVTINCGARSCLSCLNCYRKDGPTEIHELLK